MADYVWYVDPDAVGGGTGVDWANAYTSMAAAEAAKEMDLTSASDTVTFKARNTSSADSGFDFDGWTTAVGEDITIEVESGDRTPDGVFSTSYYHVIGSAWSEAINIYENYVTIHGIQVQTIANSYDAIYLRGTNCEVAYSVIMNNGSANNNNRGIRVNLTDHLIYNNVIYDFNKIGIYVAGGDSNIYIYNNTIVDCDTGIEVNFANNGTYKNNILYSNTTADWSNVGPSTGLTTAKNITSDTSSPDGGGYQEIVLTFENAGANNFDLVAGDTEAIDDGENLSGTFSDDIISAARGTWDIGAFAYTASGGVTIPIMTHHYTKSIGSR